MLYDKSVALQILGDLIKNPSLLIEDKYKISDEDFEDRLHKIVFGCIKNLYLSGVQLITPIEIDTYLSNYSAQKQVFDTNNGIIYVENLIKFSKIENFDYNYQQLKKYTLLRQLNSEGFNTDFYINENIVDPKKIDEMTEKFNKLTVNNIIDDVERRVIKVKDKFHSEADEEEQHIAKGIKDLIDSFKLSPDIGLPLNSNILNTICRGARRKKLYLDSRPSGLFKSRAKLADAAKISVPYFYDTEKKEWIHTGYDEPTLFITTELEVDEIQTMLVAYITGINEAKILDGNVSTEEEERIEQAIKYIELSKLYLVHLPNFSINDLIRTIKKYSIIYDVGYVFFDYIFTTPKMLAETSKMAKGISLRQDVLLLNAATYLKDLCNELDIFISTSTQVSDGWQETKHPDSSLIRNCKGLADKVDIAYIGLPPTKEELSLIKPILNSGIYPEPNIVYHIYKVRRGSYNKVKLFLHFDAGTCRTQELFATNNNCEYIEISGTNIEKVLDDTSTSMEEIEKEAFPDETVLSNNEVVETDTEGGDVPW